MEELNTTNTQIGLAALYVLCETYQEHYKVWEHIVVITGMVFYIDLLKHLDVCTYLLC